MSELEIRVRTRLRKRTDIDELIIPEYCHHPAWTNHNSDCLDRGDQCTTYNYPVYKHRVTIELDPQTLQMMQKENIEDAAGAISDDDVMMDEEEEEEVDTFDSSPMSVSSQVDSPNNATSSPINIPGNFFGQEGPRTRRTSSGGTPPTQCLSYLSRMFPGAQCDSSPLSSGYGSAPRYSHSASTQTPSTPVFCETLIRLRILSLSSNQSDDRQQHLTRRQRLQMQAERRSRGRVYSENNSDDLREEEEEEDTSNNPHASAGMPLPDLVAFRDRSNSAPTLMRPEIRVGRQLRRISDEFHLSYHDQQRLRARQQQTILQRLLSTLRGNQRGHREGSAV